jgi:uncharacterized phage-associated protein
MYSWTPLQAAPSNERGGKIMAGMSAGQGYPPRAVARSLLDEAHRQGHEVTNLKLQKLLYLTHGLMLAKHGRPLVNERFQAWKYGPVLESLYHDLKIYGPGRIGPTDGFVNLWKPLPPDAKEEENSIKAVLKQCGSMSSGALVSMSHAPDGPWNAVYKNQDSEIGDQAIKQYFEKIVV